MTDFDHFNTQIKDTFSQLIEQLIARRDKLLEEVLRIRDDFNNEEHTRVKSLQNIETVVLKIQEVTQKENYNRSVHEQVGLMHQQAKQEFAPITPPDLSFYCPTFSRLLSQIPKFGEVQRNSEESAQDQKNIFTPEGYKAQDSEKITNREKTFPKFNASDSQLPNQKGYSIKNRSREMVRCLTPKNLFSRSTHSIPSELNFYLSTDDLVDQNSAGKISSLKSPRSQPDLNLGEYFNISLRDFKQNNAVLTRDGIAGSFASNLTSEFPIGEQIFVVTVDEKGNMLHVDSNVEYVEKRKTRAAKKKLRSLSKKQNK